MPIAEFIKLNCDDQIMYYGYLSTLNINDQPRWVYATENSIVTMMYDVELDSRLRPFVRNMWKIQRCEYTNAVKQNTLHTYMNLN